MLVLVRQDILISSSVCLRMRKTQTVWTVLSNSTKQQWSYHTNSVIHNSSLPPKSKAYTCSHFQLIDPRLVNLYTGISSNSIKTNLKVFYKFYFEFSCSYIQTSTVSWRADIWHQNLVSNELKSLVCQQGKSIQIYASMVVIAASRGLVFSGYLYVMLLWMS